MLEGAKAALFDLGEIIVRVAVQLQHANIDHRDIAVRPDLGEVEGVPAGAPGPRVCLRLGHDLHLHLPLRIVAFLDRAVEILLRRFARTSDDLGSLRIGPVLVSLLGLEVELHPHALTGSIA